jgi:hypothetical protein
MKKTPKQTPNLTMRESAIAKLRENEKQLAAAQHDGSIHTILQVYSDGGITIHKAASSSEQSILALEGSSRVLKTYGGFGPCFCDICSASKDGKYDTDLDESFDDASDEVVERVDTEIEVGFFADEKE